MAKRPNTSAEAQAPTPGFRLWRRRVLRLAGNALFPLVHAGLARSWRWAEPIGPEASLALLNGSQPHIAVFWHEALLPGFFRLSPAWDQPAGTVATLISPSDDGAVLVASLQRLGYSVQLGSSRLRGGEALDAAIAQLQAGDASRLVMTPDGPLGPPLKAKFGSIKIAQKTGLPVVPVGLAVSPARRLGTWDRMWLPRPLARVQVALGEPLWFEAATGREQGDAQLAELNQQLDAATDVARRQIANR